MSPTKKYEVRSMKYEEKKGIALVFVVLIMSVILAIGMGISAILIQQTRLMKGIGDSVVAFYAADNGIEEVLMKDIPSDIPETSLPNGAKYQVFKSAGEDCDAQNFCIKSIGSYKKVKRAIEIKY